MLQFIQVKTSQSSALVSLTRLPTSWIETQRGKTLFEDTQCLISGNMAKNRKKSLQQKAKNITAMDLETSLDLLFLATFRKCHFETKERHF